MVEKAYRTAARPAVNKLVAGRDIATLERNSTCCRRGGGLRQVLVLNCGVPATRPRALGHGRRRSGDPPDALHAEEGRVPASELRRAPGTRPVGSWGAMEPIASTRPELAHENNVLWDRYARKPKLSRRKRPRPRGYMKLRIVGAPWSAACTRRSPDLRQLVAQRGAERVADRCDSTSGNLFHGTAEGSMRRSDTGKASRQSWSHEASRDGRTYFADTSSRSPVHSPFGTRSSRSTRSRARHALAASAERR